jgi:NAD(P)H-flavin reductase
MREKDFLSSEWIGLSDPLGSTYPFDSLEGRDIAFFAEGINLVFFIKMLEQIAEKRNNFGRLNIYIHADTEGEFIQKQRFSSWQNMPNSSLYLSVKEKNPDWTGLTGTLDSILKAGFDSDMSNSVIIASVNEETLVPLVTNLWKNNIANHQIVISMSHKIMCGQSLCSSCRIGPYLVCKDGPL